MPNLKPLVFRNHVSLFVIALLVSIVLFALLKEMKWEEVTTVIGGLAVFVFFVERQQLEEVKLFKELFQAFNNRYNELNEALNEIIQAELGKPLKKKGMAVLFDYFNFCGEGFLYYKEGYIKHNAWRAWRNGMMLFFQNERVRGLWKSEATTGSYYSFE